MNVVTLIGRVGKDPEVADVNGKKLAKFSLATSERWKDADGEKKEKTDWHNIVIWGPLAGIVEKYVSKGSQIMVSGKLQTRKYEKDGDTKYFTEVVLQGFSAQLELLGGKSREPGEEEDEPSEYERTPAKKSSSSKSEKKKFDIGDDYIPF